MEATMPDPAPIVRTTINRKWTIKMAVIGLVLLGFGIWGLIDAAVVYPRRGYVAASWLEYQYLDLFSRSRPPLDARAGIADPSAELQRLERAAIDRGSLDPVDKALAEWLDQLNIVGKLDGLAATAIPRTDFRGDQVTDARARLTELTKQWTESGEQRQSPSKLSFWDIPVQWLIMVVGVAVGLYMFFLIFRVRAKSYGWEAGQMRLTLPTGESLTPADLEDVDKRKWHKFFATLKVKSSHAQLGGKGIELDLLRYEPLEAWILEMEKTAFPDRVEPPPPTTTDSTPDSAPHSMPQSMVETQKE